VATIFKDILVIEFKCSTELPIDRLVDGLCKSIGSSVCTVIPKLKNIDAEDIVQAFLRLLYLMRKGRSKIRNIGIGLLLHLFEETQIFRVASRIDEYKVKDRFVLIAEVEDVRGIVNKAESFAEMIRGSRLCS